MKHFTTKIAATLAALMIMVPFAASALSAEDVQNQIQALMRQISALQEKIKTLQNTQTTVVSTTPPVSVDGKYRICSLLNRNLGIGGTGDDVMALQEYLQTEGYLGVKPTGYYGQITAQAVAKWQAKEGVSPAGVFGPLSRERFKIWCGGGVINTERFNASPTRGSAPLTVTFDTWISGFRINTIAYEIDFGDGTSEPATSCLAPADACVSPGKNTHTYTSNGTYVATLKKISNICPPGAQCLVAPTTEVVAKQQIQVGEAAKNFSADPQSGAAPLSVGFTYQPNEENGQYYVDFGDGSGEQMTIQQIYCIRAPCISPTIAKHVYKNPGTYTASVSRYMACLYSNPRCMMAEPAPLAQIQIVVTGTLSDPSKDPRCKAWFDGCNTCSRASADAPAACTLMYCANPAPAYCKAYFDTSSNKPPVISGISGPTTLSMNQTGTWTVTASDPENQSLSYQVTWGDEYLRPVMTSGAAMSDAFVQTSTFTHSYATNGTYTVTVVVKDASGSSAKTSTTVRVGTNDVVCTMEYAPVCGQPAWSCPAGMYCATVMPAPRTYGNKCQALAEGAQVLYAGTCTATN